jgi:chromosome segregation ATPase
VKPFKTAAAIVAIVVLAAGGFLLYKVGPMEAVVGRHEMKIGDLEKRATSAEQKLDEHDKRIAILESQVRVQGDSIAKIQADLGATRIQLEDAEGKLKQVEGRVATGETERAKLADEVAILRRKVDALEKDLVKRVEVLEKLNEGKVQK